MCLLAADGWFHFFVYKTIVVAILLCGVKKILKMLMRIRTTYSIIQKKSEGLDSFNLASAKDIKSKWMVGMWGMVEMA